MTKKGKTYEDFSFIIGEISRLKKEPGEDLENKHLSSQSDYLYFLPHLPDFGITIIGYKAARRFHELAERTLKCERDLAERVTIDALSKTIQHLFREEILCNKKELTQSLADKIVSRSIKYIRGNKLNTIRHFFPCILPLDKENEHFVIGPVQFFRIETFLDSKAEGLENYTGNVKKHHLNQLKKQGKSPTSEIIEEIANFATTLEGDFREYYEKYPWVASIEISDFETEKSREISELCVRMALNILRLFFPPSHAEQIHFSGSAYREIKTAFLTEQQDGKLSISFRKRFDVSDETGWVKAYALEGERAEFLACVGNFITFLASGRPIPLLYQRYLNGLWWYAEALSHHDLPYIKVISLSNALEAILGTTDGNPDISISDQIAERASLLLEIQKPAENWVRRIKTFYDVRSNLVHGRVPAFDKTVKKQISWGIEIVRLSLLEGLSWTLYLAHERCLDDIKVIDQKFQTDLNKFTKQEFNN